MTWSQWPLTWALTNWTWADEWTFGDIVFGVQLPWCELGIPLVPGTAIAGHLVDGATLVPAAIFLHMPSTVTVTLQLERVA